MFCVVMVFKWFFFFFVYTPALGEFVLVDVPPSIPLLVLICKVLAKGLPARLSSGGREQIGFFCFVV